MKKTKPLKPKCKCACHEPRFKNGLEHETRCCNEMNGSLMNEGVKKLLSSLSQEALRAVGEDKKDPIKDNYTDAEIFGYNIRGKEIRQKLIKLFEEYIKI